MNGDDPELDPWLARYPPADLTPEEFEQFVADLFRSAHKNVEDLQVTSHERIAGVDGVYDFDATVRYRLLGMNFLVVVEAKKHAHSIKRELVQVLDSKVRSVGAHKGVLISTARFQRGAIEFAQTHGIALVYVTEGRFTFETRAATPVPYLSREEAAEAYGIPTFVGVYIGPGRDADGIMLAIVGEDDPASVCELLLGQPKSSWAS